MLDDLKYIHERDAQDALGIAEKQWQQLEQDFEIEYPDSFADAEPTTNIVFAGMGGSALAALLSQTWPGYTVPFEISRDYTPPHHLHKNTLFVASSYSGNTEETIEALGHAEEAGALIAIITSGGKLADIAREKHYPLIVLPGGFQPRFASLFALKALITLLERAGFVKTEQAEVTLKKTAEYLQSIVSAWRADVPTKDNYAKQIALELMGKSVVIYGGPLMFPAAYKWKISCNENAKNVAWCNEIPEFNHNEFLGWTSHPVEKPYAVVDLRSHLEHPRVLKRFEVTEKLLSGKRPAPIVIDVLGDTLLEQLLWAVALGDFVTIYLAFLNGLNPTPVDLIEKFKKSLDS